MVPHSKPSSNQKALRIFLNTLKWACLLAYKTINISSAVFVCMFALIYLSSFSASLSFRVSETESESSLSSASSPQSCMSVGTLAISRITSMPNTTCLSSR